MYCRFCGTKLDDSAKFCPECGKKADFNDGASVPVVKVKTAQPVQIVVERQENETAQPQAHETEEKINKLGVAGFVLGILSTTFGFTIIMPILAFIFGLIGTCLIKKYNTSNGLAIAGLVLSVIDLAVWMPLISSFFGSVLNL